MLYLSLTLIPIGVGKSCLLDQFMNKKCNTEYLLTIGVDFGIKVVDYKGEPIKLQIWDTVWVIYR